jgi:hypothetical protein
MIVTVSFATAQHTGSSLYYAKRTVKNQGTCREIGLRGYSTQKLSLSHVKKNFLNRNLRKTAGHMLNS